jgi:hypothetical protein
MPASCAVSSENVLGLDHALISHRTLQETTMAPSQRASSEWFEEAARCYVEQHQGCAWCGGSHRVFKVHKGSKIEYYCNGCDFLAGYDPEAGTHFCVPGEAKTRRVPDTMLEW